MDPEIIMNNPECLIENVDGHKLVVKEETMKILSEISNPVVVIAIVGKYRTGKSYLMNRLAGQKSGFALGSTIQSKTKGIWMWCVPHPTQPDYTLVLLDTEGLGDVEKGSSANDAWIFSLAVLLSSNFVYNSVGTIDHQSMEQLQYVTELTKRIRMKSDKNDENSSGEFKRFFPTFTWCVRDFTLDLKMDEKDVTSDEYLTNVLKEKEGKTKEIQNYNLPRRCILHFFHSFRCFVFERPAPGKKIKQLEKLEDKDLDEDFRAQADEFCKYMFEEGQVKTLIGGKEVNGKSLSHLTHSYVEAIQKGSVPCLENALQALAEIENKEAVNKALSKYEMEMQEHAKNFPTKTQLDLLNIHKECEKLALEVFFKSCFQDEEQKYQHNLKEKLETKLNSFLKCNEEESKKKCLKVLQNLSKTIDTDISEGKYYRSGGYQEFLEKKTKLVDEYNKTAGDLLKASEALQLFLSEKRTIEQAIMQADKNLTQKEKELAEQEAKIKAAEIENKLKEENENKIKELLEIQKKSHEQHIEMLKKKTEEDRENMKRENEKLIERKLEEMRMYNQCMARTNELERELIKMKRGMENPFPCTIS